MASVEENTRNAELDQHPILMAHFLGGSSRLEEHDMAIPYYHVDAFTGGLVLDHELNAVPITIEIR
jgi:hypothetical protein